MSSKADDIGRVMVLRPLNCHVSTIKYSVAIINKDVIILRGTHTLCDYMSDTTQSVCMAVVRMRNVDHTHAFGHSFSSW